MKRLTWTGMLIALVACSGRGVLPLDVGGLVGTANLLSDVVHLDGSITTFGGPYLENNSAYPVVLVSMTASTFGPVEVVGFRARTDQGAHGIYGGGCGPFPDPNLPTVPVPGYVVKPHQGVKIFVGMRPRRLRGGGGMSQATVTYRFRGRLDRQTFIWNALFETTRVPRCTVDRGRLPRGI